MSVEGLTSHDDVLMCRSEKMAMLEREKRATAGQRMSALMGEELEKDQSFWGHETWEEEAAESEYSESTGNRKLGSNGDSHGAW